MASLWYNYLQTEQEAPTMHLRCLDQLDLTLSDHTICYYSGRWIIDYHVSTTGVYINHGGIPRVAPIALVRCVSYATNQCVGPIWNTRLATGLDRACASALHALASSIVCHSKSQHRIITNTTTVPIRRRTIQVKSVKSALKVTSNGCQHHCAYICGVNSTKIQSTESLLSNRQSL